MQDDFPVQRSTETHVQINGPTTGHRRRTSPDSAEVLCDPVPDHFCTGPPGPGPGLGPEAKQGAQRPHAGGSTNSRVCVFEYFAGYVRHTSPLRQAVCSLSRVVNPYVPLSRLYASLPDAEEAQFGQADGTGQDALTGQPAPIEVLRHVGAHFGERGGDLKDMGVLRVLLLFAELRVYRYWPRPAESVPVACRFPLDQGQIQTSRHAGGMTSHRSRSFSSGSVIGCPAGSR